MVKMKFFITRKEIKEMIDKAVRETIKYLSLRCQTCGSGLIKFKESSPDDLPYYFCSKKCHKRWRRGSGQVYRSLPLERIR